MVHGRRKVEEDGFHLFWVGGWVGVFFFSSRAVGWWYMAEGRLRRTVFICFGWVGGWVFFFFLQGGWVVVHGGGKVEEDGFHLFWVGGWVGVFFFSSRAVGWWYMAEGRLRRTVFICFWLGEVGVCVGGWVVLFPGRWGGDTLWREGFICVGEVGG